MGHIFPETTFNENGTGDFSEVHSNIPFSTNKANTLSGLKLIRVRISQGQIEYPKAIPTY